MAQFQMRHERQGSRGYLLKIIGAILGLGMLIYIIWSFTELMSSAEHAAGSHTVRLENTYYELVYDTMECRPLKGSYRLLAKRMGKSGTLYGSVRFRRDGRIPSKCNDRIEKYGQNLSFMVPPVHMQFDSTAQAEVAMNSNLIARETPVISAAVNRWNNSAIQWAKSKGELQIEWGRSSGGLLYAAARSNTEGLALVFDKEQLDRGNMTKLIGTIDKIERLLDVDIFKHELSSKMESGIETTLTKGEWPLIN